jgi:hypothetical protein
MPDSRKQRRQSWQVRYMDDLCRPGLLCCFRVSDFNVLGKIGLLLGMSALPAIIKVLCLSREKQVCKINSKILTFNILIGRRGISGYVSGTFGYGHRTFGYRHRTFGYGHRTFGYGHRTFGYGHRNFGYGHGNFGYGYGNFGYGHETLGYGYGNFVRQCGNPGRQRSQETELLI